MVPAACCERLARIDSLLSGNHELLLQKQGLGMGSVSF